VQVNPELVEIADGRPTTRWQAPFDASLTDVFKVQTDIAGQVAEALNLALADSSRRELAERPTENLAAYDAYLRGEGVSNGLTAGDPATLRRAATYYEQATTLDPAFALAWAHLGVARSRLYFNGVPAPAVAEAARTAVARAMALAPGRAESHHARGWLFLAIEHDAAKAEQAFQAALRLAPSDPMTLSALSSIEIGTGHADSAVAHAGRAAGLDPRSANAAGRYGLVLRRLRRYPEAIVAFDHALALAPADLATREQRAMVALQQGDLEGARAVLRAAPPEVDPGRLIAYVGTYWDLAWVLDDAQQQALLRLPPAAFDDNRGAWGIVKAQTEWLRGDRASTRAWGDTASAEFAAQLRGAPDDAQEHVLHALALAYAGSSAEAIREAEAAVATVPASNQLITSYLRHQLAKIFLVSGQPEKALDQLEPLLQVHYDLTPGWLRIDPNFAALRGNPRFERLTRGE
jgi:serine/threonine-protein kinase